MVINYSDANEDYAFIQDMTLTERHIVSYLFHNPSLLPVFHPLSRYNNPTYIFHFMTSTGETAPSGSYYEKRLGFVLPTRLPNSIPLYRLKLIENGVVADYFFTRSQEEMSIAKSRGYGDDGIVGYVFADSSLASLYGSPVQVFRFNNPTLKDHFYTTDTAEVNLLLTQTFRGYIQEVQYPFYIISSF